MGDKIRNLKMNISIDTSSLEEMMHDYEKIIDRVNFHYDGLEKAINDFKNYKPNLEIKYSVAAPSNKSCRDCKDDGISLNKKSTKLCCSKSCTFNTDGSFIIQNQSDHYLE